MCIRDRLQDARTNMQQILRPECVPMKDFLYEMMRRAVAEQLPEAEPGKDVYKRQAMICSPSLLIADEPTTALDVTVQLSIVKLLACLLYTSRCV